MPATGYFYPYDVRAEVEILKDQVIVNKYKCGTNGSREYGQYHSTVTTALDSKFVAEKQFVPTIC